MVGQQLALDGVCPREPMYAASLWRPWPWTFTADIVEPKRVENRESIPWPRVIGRRVAFHATQKFDRVALERIRARGVPCPEDPAQHPLGIVFVATVRGWVRREAADGPRAPRHANLPGYGGNLSAEDVRRARTSPWFFGPIGWVVDGVVALAEPVPCKGRQSLLWALPADVEARVVAQTGAA